MTRPNASIVRMRRLWLSNSCDRYVPKASVTVLLIRRVTVRSDVASFVGLRQQPPDCVVRFDNGVPSGLVVRGLTAQGIVLERHGPSIAIGLAEGAAFMRRRLLSLLSHPGILS